MVLLLVIFFIPQKEINNALEILNLEKEAFDFPRLDWAEVSFVLPIVKELMESPLNGEKYVRRIKKALNGSKNNLIKTISEDLGFSFKDISLPIDSLPDLVSIINEAGRLYQEAFKSLNRRERLILLSILPRRWENEDSPEDDWLKVVLLNKYNISFDTAGINEDTVIKIVEKVDFEKLIRVGILIIQIAEEVPKLLRKIEDGVLPLKFESKFGVIFVGTRGKDEYKGASFVIDPGGDDNYINCGGGIGLLDSSLALNFIVDVEGNDVYLGEDIISIGSGFGGVGFIFDFGGNDKYYGTHFSIGCGYLGFGFIEDFEGDDFYKGGIFSLGAANFGIGILLDHSGNDFYSTDCFGEGFGSTLGFGILADFCGSDVYYAGGKYFNTPLNPNSFLSMAQGFGLGRRPDFGGGIGFLYDKSGNDFYNGDVYAQGVSYWCSAGFLLDEEGEDKYLSTEYSKGTGIHLSYGFLADIGGNDVYFSSKGPGLGEGHDLSCGILIDSSGNDWYMVSGGVGLGLHNSIGIFADLSGEDVYNITEELGIGDANYSRGFSGIGIFVDLMGKDFYPEGRGSDDTYWINGDYGVGIDKNSEEREEIPQRKVPDFSRMSIKEIFKIASEWEVGNNKDRVKEARKALLKREKESIKYIFEDKLNTKDALELRAIIKFLKELKDSLLVENYLREYISVNEEEARRNVYLLIGELNLKNLGDSLISALSREEEKLIRTIVYSLGKIKEKRAVNKLISYLSLKDERLLVVSITALGEIRDTAAIRPLLPLINSPSLIVKSAAINSLVQFDTLIIPYIKENLRGDFPPEFLIVVSKAIEKYSDSFYKDEVKKLLFEYVKNSDWKKREFSVRGLSLLGGEDVKTLFLEILPNEKSYIIKGIIERFLKKVK
ncbi:MAG: HEAT repeat domain-containing protein [candidate division WOR-3 bacterium]